MCLTFLTALGSYQNDTIGTTHTIHSSGRSIFQHGDVGHFIGVDLREAAFHTIYQYQRIGTVERCLSADKDVRVVGTRCT